ncbi:alpha/beta hydrolase [Streptomyces sp. NPDC013178]|uniref:alpha/beta fold hydrolase n=1 Tax=Streptomyces sp. NPDC013178 TaxID=3155118 RepID=UPI0033E55D40
MNDIRPGSPADTGVAVTAKPTVVLVHGAFVDSSIWDKVIGLLARRGYPAVAVANPLRGLSSDARYTRSVLASIQGPVVLVGHCYGGSVISAAAAGADDVRALVYVAGFIPDEEESAAELSMQFPGSTLGEVLREIPVGQAAEGTAAADLCVEPHAYHRHLAADLPQEVARTMAVTQRPVSSAAWHEEAVEVAWQFIPSWALVAGADQALAAETQIHMAERALAYVTTVDASHSVALSHPEAVMDVIEQAASKTA